MFSLFLSFQHPDSAARLSQDDRAVVETLLGAVAGTVRALVMVPAEARDLYHAAVPAPMLTVQMYFEGIAQAEAAIAAGAPLIGLNTDSLYSLQGADATHQVMLVRNFPEPSHDRFSDGRSCAFMVHYPGVAEDLNVWLGHYLAHHPPIMTTFPDIREVEVCTRVDWIDAAPWRRVHHFQRNKVVFDDAAALQRALSSPVRTRMKDDFDSFPPFTGGSVHVPMICDGIRR